MAQTRYFRIIMPNFGVLATLPGYHSAKLEDAECCAAKSQSFLHKQYGPWRTKAHSQSKQ